MWKADPLSFAVSPAVPHMARSAGTAPDLTYTPDTGFNGADSFTFKVNDGELNSDAVMVEITVNPANDVPTANSQSVSTDEDTALVITLTGSDFEGSALTYTVANGPDHGTLSGTGARCDLHARCRFQWVGQLQFYSQ